MGSGRRRLASACAPAAALLLCCGLPAAAEADGCANAATPASQASPRDLATAALCVVNAERARRGLPALRSNARLRRAAAEHADDMTTRDYFSHDSPDGETVRDRCQTAGYMRGAKWWSVGEVQHWATDDGSAPALAVASLLASPPHRKLLLSRVFRDAGVAIVQRTPVAGDTGGATYVIELGRRR